jgi:cytochrome c-type biogenesis protein
MQEVNVWIAFLAGVASFISPCCLPLFPSYISYITGITVSQLKHDNNSRDVRIRMLSHTAFFVIGFSIVFYTLGLGAGALGDFFSEYRQLIGQLAAILIIVMGLFLIGLFRPEFMMKERKLPFRFRPVGYLGTMLVGFGFAAGWSPCIGPILVAIIALAVKEPSSWFMLITAYILGFALPFMVLAFFLGSVKWILKYSNLMMKLGGGFMIVMGVLLYTDKMYKITIWFNNITPEWMKF